MRRAMAAMLIGAPEADIHRASDITRRECGNGGGGGLAC
jgi:hypothetical protein